MAEQRSLFLVLCYILKSAHYATVIVLVDQAEKLVGDRTLTDELMNIHGPSGNAGLNLFLVFAGAENVDELAQTAGHGGFFRRFIDPQQCSSIDVVLVSPSIGDEPDNDVDRIRKVLTELRDQYPGLPVPEFDDDRAKRIRSQLQLMAARGPVTWPMFWRSMLGA